MGRIATRMTVENSFDPEKKMECGALVDMYSSHMIPVATRQVRSGKPKTLRRTGEWA